MSAKAEKKAEAAAPEGAPKKKKGLLFIIIGLVVVLAGGGAGAFVMMHKADKKAQAAKGGKHAKAEGGHEGDEHEEEEGEEEHDKGKGKKPVFYSMEPFVVNLAGDAQHYLQVGVDLKLSKDEYTEKIKTVLPEIRNDVVMLLSSKQATEVVSMEDKNYLRAQIRAAANKAIGVKDGVKPRNPEQQPAAAHEGEEDHGSEAPRKGVVDVLLTSFVIQ